VTDDEFISGLGHGKDLMSDALKAWALGGADIPADVAVAEDIADLVGLVLPPAAIAAKIIPALELLVLALKAGTIQGGVGANEGPRQGGKIGSR
jgi:hypothetical protein